MSIKGFKKYKCDECGKNFTYNIGLKEHIILQAAVHERKDFNCDQCGKKIY